MVATRLPLVDLLRGVWAGKTIYRRWMELDLRDAPLRGLVLDLGGGGSGLVPQRGAVRRAVLVDIRLEVRPHVVADLEQPLPIADKSVDTVVLLNVLEHVRDVARVVAEAARVLREGGVLVMFAPFLYPVHTARHPDFFLEDYSRLSESALRRLLVDEGPFGHATIRPAGRGPFTAAANLLVTELKFRPLKIAVTAGAVALDRVHARFDARRQSIARRAWPLGYYVEAMR
jgi:SAM-dependent methyltransferase